MEIIDNKTVRNGVNWSVEVPSIHELKYIEGDKSLTLEIEGGSDDSGVHWYIYQPNIWVWDGNKSNLYISAVKIKIVKKRIHEALSIMGMKIKEFT